MALIEHPFIEDLLASQRPGEYTLEPNEAGILLDRVDELIYKNTERPFEIHLVGDSNERPGEYFNENNEAKRELEKAASLLGHLSLQIPDPTDWALNLLPDFLNHQDDALRQRARSLVIDSDIIDNYFKAYLLNGLSDEKIVNEKSTPPKRLGKTAQSIKTELDERTEEYADSQYQTLGLIETIPAVLDDDTERAAVNWSILMNHPIKSVNVHARLTFTQMTEFSDGIPRTSPILAHLIRSGLVTEALKASTASGIPLSQIAVSLTPSLLH